MGGKNNYAIPLIIIVSFLIIFILVSITVISTRSIWVPFVASVMPSNKPSQTPYPTYTPLPTYTVISTSTIFPTPSLANTPEFITGYLPNYDMMVTIPSNWNIWETNPRKYNGDGATCYDYLIDSPDYQQEVKIYVICGGWDTLDMACPSGTVAIGEIQATKIVRFPDKLNPNKYIYASSYLTGDCMVPGEASVWLKFHGELQAYFINYSYSGNANLDLADSIILSFLHNP
jgi:hypothetical protein